MAKLAIPHHDLAFPDRRDRVTGYWAPIYIEPMVGSGERITIGVAVVNNDRSIVVPVAALTRLKCIYGDENEALMYSASAAVESLNSSLHTSGKPALENWKSPFEGVYVGAIRPGVGNSMEEIARAGLVFCSSLVEKIADADEEDEPQASVSEARLERLIRQSVIASRPGLEQAFGRLFQPQQNARAAKISFVGQRLAANFGLLVPTYLPRQVKDAKSKLWDLAQVQEYVTAKQFGLGNSINRFELLIHRTRDSDPQFSDKQVRQVQEAVTELELEADKKNIRCRPLQSPDEIARAILEAEAA